ncbi:MAG: shikimate dehydrogenase [Rhodospirillaceae bacterium]|nr:shikimate dehydrogenase [Rhodospirillaceae bacterium]
MILSRNITICGVIGYPVSHSLSPVLHNFWIKKYKQNGTYIPFAVDPNKLNEAIVGIINLGIKGVNVTLPHKESVLKYVQQLTDNAKEIGAVNTLTLNKEGKIIGDNTDAFGFLANLKDFAPHLRFASQKAIILGAGGVAKSVCFALINSGISEVIVVNRNKERAEKIKEKFGSNIRVEIWENRDQALEDVSILINCTSLGMNGQPALEISLEKLPPDAVVNDLVYTPINTRLLIEARKRGHISVDGLGMLLHQAKPAFHSWFDIQPEVSIELRNHVLASISQ